MIRNRMIHRIFYPCSNSDTTIWISGEPISGMWCYTTHTLKNDGTWDIDVSENSIAADPILQTSSFYIGVNDIRSQPIYLYDIVRAWDADTECCSYYLVEWAEDKLLIVFRNLRCSNTCTTLDKLNNIQKVGNKFEQRCIE